MILQKKIKVVLFFLGVAALAGGYWYWANVWVRELHWQPGPEVNFVLSDLKRVRFVETNFDKIATKRVIAVTLTTFVVTNPETIRRVADGLVKVKTIDGYRPTSGIRVIVVFEDYTGMRFTGAPDWCEKVVYGVDWDSKALYPVFLDILGVDEQKEREMVEQEKVMRERVDETERRVKDMK